MATRRVEALAWEAFRRLGGGGGDGSHGDDGPGDVYHTAFGVHIEYEDLYDSMIFLTCIYVAGKISSRLLKMPDLVGEIFAGILLGPPLAEFVPNAEAWVLLGEIGLVLLVLEAGIDIDVSTLKLIGARGFLIAFVGSVLPIGIGIALAFAIGTDTTGAIAAGAAFGPTSLGIALNILRSGGVLNTPVGQLIISAAVIDDMIALVVLSQLEALVGDINVTSILIPVISAVSFLVIGGYVAIFVLPGIIGKYVLSRVDKEHQGKIEMTIMFAILLVMMPATFYAKASYLMGAFVAGLSFCTSHEVHTLFVRQFKRVMSWLMRIFFAASIGFQVPIKDFGNGTVIWQGLMFTAALLGKLAVGFMVPNFTQEKSFTNMHLRDCLVTGFSMAAEGEFAFVIAVFAVDQELISVDLYASVVLAVLLSTIIPPFLLRFTIAHYNKKAEQTVRNAARAEMERNHDLETGREDSLVESIKNKTTVFLCIQTQSAGRWGLLLHLMDCMKQLGLDVIDHRSWHPRGIDTTLVNEIYVKDSLDIKTAGNSQAALEDRIKDIQAALENVINQPNEASVKVQRWYPGVVKEIVEDVEERASTKRRNSLAVEARLLSEATNELERRRMLQTNATVEKSVSQILGESTTPAATLPEIAETGDQQQPKKARRRRQKMRSTPVVGGGLFGETAAAQREEQLRADQKQRPLGGAAPLPSAFSFQLPGHRAEIVVNGETYNIRISEETLRNLDRGHSGDMIHGDNISISGVSDKPVVDRLKGYVRSELGSLNSIAEETADEVSDKASHDGGLS